MRFELGFCLNLQKLWRNNKNKKAKAECRLGSTMRIGSAPGREEEEGGNGEREREPREETRADQSRYGGLYNY